MKQIDEIKQMLTEAGIRFGKIKIKEDSLMVVSYVISIRPIVSFQMKSFLKILAPLE